MTSPPERKLDTKRRTLMIAGALSAVGGAGAATPEATAVVLGTATPGGGFPVYGAAFAETIHENDPTLRIETRNTKGSTENIPLVESGALDLGLVTGEPLHEAFEGIGRPKADLRVLWAMYSSPGMFVARGDSDARRIADLTGRKVAFGAKGSGLVILARYVLDGLGLDMERDFQAVYLDRAGDGPAMVEDGRVAALWGGGLGWPGFIAVSKSPKGGRFIAPDAAEAQRILAKHALLRPLVVPANTYAGQDAAIASVGSWACVIARPSLPEETAYRLARALHRGEGAIARRLPQARESTAANTVAAVAHASRLHPGVQRYLREANLLK
jgi:TRAP transporter TAXI family solute receptor